jgi:hypothetical protein
MTESTSRCGGITARCRTVAKFVCMLFSGILLLLVFPACTIKNNVTMQPSGAGTIEINYRLEPFLIEFIKEMGGLVTEESELEEGTLFNLDKIRADFDKNPTIAVVKLESPKPEILTGRFSFENIEEVVRFDQDIANVGVVSYSEKNGEKTVSLFVDRQIFAQLIQYAEILQNPMVEMFGPLANEGVTEEEYIEMMSYALGEEGGKYIMDSYIEVVVKVDGTLVSQKNGTTIPGGVMYKIPVIRVLLLDTPLDYSLTFK